MALIVQKYGGTSLASAERIRHVARRVQRSHRAGNRVVVVVSAMAGETDRLVGLAAEVAPNGDRREYDVVLSSGEQVTAGLLALANDALRVPVRTGARKRRSSPWPASPSPRGISFAAPRSGKHGFSTEGVGAHRATRRARPGWCCRCQLVP